MPTAELQSRTVPGLPTHPSGDDAALVQRMRSGDEGSFEAIFKRHHAPLLSYCRHMLGNQDEAEDALQQAFIRAHKALLGGSPPRELRPWLYAIARNCCLSAISARRPTAPLEDHALSLAGLSDQVREREDLRELLADIGKLPEDQRSALLLAELDDLSHQAIATVVRAADVLAPAESQRGRSAPAQRSTQRRCPSSLTPCSCILRR
jgi:RNA polymerase sigma factor (sigma-70 family)